MGNKALLDLTEGNYRALMGADALAEHSAPPDRLFPVADRGLGRLSGVGRGAMAFVMERTAK